MQSVWLLLIALLGYVAGVAIVYSLTGNVHHIRRYQALALVAAVVALVFAFSALDGWLRFVGLLLIPLLVVAGYLLRTRALLHSEDTRNLPPLTRAAGDAGAGFTAVIYLAHGEPEQYDPTGLINAYREADAAGLPAGPVWARPFALAQLRKQYMDGRRSDQRTIHRRTLKALANAQATADGPPMRYYLAFLDDEPRPEAAVVQALNEGADALVVLEVYTVDTPHSAGGRQRMMAAAAQLENGPPIRFSGPLADSTALQQLVAQRVVAQTSVDERATTGVLLVAFARTPTWVELLPESAAAEVRFLDGVQAALEAAGFPLVRQARLHGEPPPINMAEALAEAGAERVLYTLVTESANSDLSQRALPQALAGAMVPDGVSLINLGGWNDDPQLVAALQQAMAATQA